VRTRVTRRSEASVSSDRLETSEFLEQVFEDGSGESQGICSCWMVLQISSMEKIIQGYVV
jgi:hypothetical protein